MNVLYKGSSNAGKAAPLRWNRFISLATNIEKNLQSNEKNSPLELITQTEFILAEICLKFHESMLNANLKSTKYWLEQLYKYSDQNIVSDDDGLHSSSIVPDLNIIIANDVKVFDFEIRRIAIETIYNFVNETTTVSEVFLQCNTIQLLSKVILGDANNDPLYLSSLKCLRKFANHCENCQETVCENFPFDYMKKAIDELNENNEITQIHAEIFTILKNISEFLLCQEFVEFCFDNFVMLMEFSLNMAENSTSMTDNFDTLTTISLLGVSNLTNYQSRNDWYKPFEQSRLPIILPKTLNSRDFRIIQTTLLLIASIYRQKQSIATMNRKDDSEDNDSSVEIPTINFKQIVEKLHYEDDLNSNSNVDAKSTVRYYTAVAIYEIIKGDEKFMNMMVKNHFLEAFEDVFEKSSFDVKFELAKSIEEIAINGYEEDKLQLIKRGFVPYFIDMIDIENKESLSRVILSLDKLFELVSKGPNPRQACADLFYNAPNYKMFIDLIVCPYESVRQEAVAFLDRYVPK